MMGHTKKLLCFLLLVAVQATYGSVYRRTKSYHNDLVATCNDKNDRRVKMMMEQGDIDVWKIHPSGVVEMRMDRSMYSSIQQYVRDVCYISILNVEAHLQEAEETMLSDSQKMSQNVDQMAISQEEELLDSENWFKKYHDFPTIVQWYRQLSENHPNLVKFVSSIGTTAEGRHIPVVRITASKQTQEEKPKFYMQCLIHAREWISGSVCMHKAKTLVNGYARNERVTSLLNAMEFVIVPVVNPDGYSYTWKHDRLWRKNRAQISSTTKCQGVDLNRNFPVGWTKDRVCSNTYSGASVASERETKAVMEYFKKNEPIVGSIDFHSYGQLILRPWGFKGETSKHEAIMADLGEEMANKIQMASGKKYTSEKSHDLYEARGIASDWFYRSTPNDKHRALSYTIELRDKGLHSFVLPKDQIQATCEEVNEAFLHLAETSLERYNSQQF